MPSEVISQVSGQTFEVNGVRFRTLLPDDLQRQTTKDEVVILKSPTFLQRYDAVMDSLPNANVVEVGMAEAGSLIYFALAFPNLRFVGIDLRHPSEVVLSRIKELGLSDRIKLYYNTSQIDQSKIKDILHQNFAGEPLGAIIDDASHMYDLSRRTFEIFYPRLAPTGMYCLEDWGWAHEAGIAQNGQLWPNEKSLANLLFEICLLQPSTRDMIREIRVTPAVAFVERGAEQIDNLRFEDLLRLRGRKIIPV